MNFFIEDFLKSDTADKWNIRNIPTDVKVYTNLMRLVVDFLQPLRDYMKTPIIITSGFRTQSVNTLVGGESNSQHLVGEAADFFCPKFSIQSVATAIRTKGLPFDQLILYPKKNFIHVSLKEKGNRKETLTK